ncbi:hypothetical protein MJO28_007463, partial [Puccinia striiformis f. sp. tritici]
LARPAQAGVSGISRLIRPGYLKRCIGFLQPYPPHNSPAIRYHLPLLTSFFGLHLPAFNSTRSNISAKMNTTLYALLSLAVATLSVGAVGQTNQCQFYASVGVKGYTCNERPDIICSEGCKSFVTMTGCVLTQYPKKPATTELCTVGYGRDTAAFKVCPCLQPVSLAKAPSVATVLPPDKRLAPVAFPEAMSPGLIRSGSASRPAAHK